MKKQILKLSIMFWTFLILYFSSQDASSSKEVSVGLTEKIIELIPEVVKEDVKIKDLNIIHHLIREGAHIFIYFVEGILLSIYSNKYRYAFLFCVILAILDEINQEYFTIGRAFQMIDLYKDWLGSGIAILLVKNIRAR